MLPEPSEGPAADTHAQTYEHPYMAAGKPARRASTAEGDAKPTMDTQHGERREF